MPAQRPRASFEPIPPDGRTLSSEPGGRVSPAPAPPPALLAAASADELDFVVSDDVAPPAVGRCRASGKANLDEDVGECSTEATPAVGDCATAVCAGSAVDAAVTGVVLALEAEAFLLITGEA